MVVTAHVRIRHRGCVTQSFSGGVTMAQLSGERGWDLFLLQGPTPEAVAKALADSEAHVNGKAEVLGGTPTSLVFRGRNSPGGIIEAMRRGPCSILWPVVYRDGLEYYTLLAPTRAALQALLEGLRAHGEVALERVSDVAPDGLEAAVPVADLTSTLTARQLDVLLKAVQQGLYDTPRRTSTQALADSFGVSPSTLKEHLRKAERGVLERVASILAHHEALARGATRRTGRPKGPRGSR